MPEKLLGRNKRLGVNDIDFLGPDWLGITFPSPGNNPFHFEIREWCLKHGVRIHQDEVALLYKYHEIPNVSERYLEFENIRKRYHVLKEKFNKHEISVKKIKDLVCKRFSGDGKSCR